MAIRVKFLWNVMKATRKNCLYIAVMAVFRRFAHTIFTGGSRGGARLTGFVEHKYLVFVEMCGCPEKP